MLNSAIVSYRIVLYRDVCFVCSGESVDAPAARTLVGDSPGVRGRDSIAVRLWRLSHQVACHTRAGVQVLVLLSTRSMVQTDSSTALLYTG